MRLLDWLSRTRTPFNSSNAGVSGRRKRLRGARPEVLETRMVLASDFGDLPQGRLGSADGYRTTASAGGASHVIDATQTKLFLGTGVDAELDGTPNVAATGDDLTAAGVDDEDGVFDPANDLRFTTGSAPLVRVRARNRTGSDATLFGWIDLDRDREFEASERVSVTVPGNVANRVFQLQFPSIPLDVLPGPTYVRLRLSADPRAGSPNGAVLGGEVEDYVAQVTLQSTGYADVSKEVQLGKGDYNSPMAARDFSGYGKAVASLGDLDGDGVTELFVGDPSHSWNGKAGAGEFYVQFMNSNGSVKRSRLVGDVRNGGPSLNEQDAFARAVTVLGDIDADGINDIAVGAPGTNGSRGAVYILRLKADGTVKSQTRIASTENGGPTLAAGEFFGQALASVGDLDGNGVTDIAVGASLGDIGTETGSLRGSMYVVFLNRDGTAASHVRIARGINGAPLLRQNDNFGFALASLGDIDRDGVTDLAVGAPGGRDEAVTGGGVYIVRLNANGTVKASSRISSLTYASPLLFGAAVTSMGDLDADGISEIVVGVPQSLGVYGYYAGGIVLLRLNSDGTVKSFLDLNAPVANQYAFETGERIGTAVASLGDLNGDGAIDLAVSRFDADVGQGTFPPLKLLFMNGKDYGRQSRGPLPNPIEPRTFSGVNGATLFGRSTGHVSSIGDFNGDGLEDFVMDLDEGQLTQPAVVFGNARGFDVTFDTRNLNGTNGFLLDLPLPYYNGSKVSGGGDINGDGLADFIIGSDEAQTDNLPTGAAFVILGCRSPMGPVLKARDLNGSNGFRINGIPDQNIIGSAVSIVGDVNADGFSDIAIGAAFSIVTVVDASVVHVIFGRSAPYPRFVSLANLDGSNGFRIYGDQRRDAFGASVSTEGDFNGDGIDDILIASPARGRDANATYDDDAGAAYVVFGKRANFPSSFGVGELDGSNGFRLDSFVESIQAMAMVVSAVDVNGDGVDDVVVGVGQEGSVPGFGAYRSILVFGRKGSVTANRSVRTLNAADGVRWFGGARPANAGDVNGDGYNDLVIGAPTLWGEQIQNPNESYVVFGGPTLPGDGSTLQFFDANQALRILLPSNETRRYPNSVTAGDVNGDGFDDVLLGAESLPTTLIFGGNFSGTPQRSSGTPAYRGAESQTFVVARSTDAAIAGAGADVVTLDTAVFRRIDGGTGEDVLRVRGNVNLDLTAIPDNKLFDIEQIDLTDRTPTTLTLSLQEVLNLSGTSNTLKVRRGSTDTLTIAGFEEAQHTTSSGTGQLGRFDIDTYAVGAATLVVETYDQTAPAGAFVPVSATPIAVHAGVVTLNFSEPVSGVDVSDFLLTRDGRTVSLTGVTLSGSEASYGLDLTSVTGIVGEYILKLRTAVANIGDEAGNPLSQQVRTRWVRVAPTAIVSLDRNRIIEGQSATITVTLDLPTDTVTILSIQDMQQLVAQGDFVASSTVLRIPAGETTATITLSQTQDDVAEGTETYSFLVRALPDIRLTGLNPLILQIDDAFSTVAQWFPDV